MENITKKADSKSKPKRLGDVFTTLWLETAGLTVFMSLAVLAPTFFNILGQ